jgi:cytochrome c oxidase subunit III
MKPQSVLDVSRLPTYAYGNRSLMWWGTWGMILIEGTVFVIALVTYYYLRDFSESWPPEGDPPRLLFGTLNLVILLVSGIPNQWAKKAAEAEDLAAVRLWLVVGLLFSIAFIVVRAFEFPALNTHYDANAYGSIVYMILILHTVHLVTDTADTAVLTVLMFTGPLEGRRFVDVAENALYWWFVVLSWIPIYFTIYIAPRML